MDSEDAASEGETKEKNFEAESANYEEDCEQKEEEEEDVNYYLNQVIEPVDPADLPTLHEVRRLKREFDENSKTVENLIKIAKESKLEQNLLQTIHLQLPDRNRAQSTKADLVMRLRGSQDKKPTYSTTSVIDSEVPLIAKIPNQNIRRNCLYFKEIAYYDGVSAETPREEGISYFYRQLKKEESSDQNTSSAEGPLEAGDKNFISQWRELRKRESEARLAAEAANAVDKVASERNNAERNGSTPEDEEVIMRGEGEGEGDQKSNGMERRKIELATFTHDLGKRISRLQRDAAKFTEDRSQTSFMQAQTF